MNHHRISISTKLHLKRPKIYRKIFDFFREGPAGRFHIDGNHGAVIMGERHFETACMSQSAVKLQVSGLHIGIGVIFRRIFQSAFPAVIDTKYIPARTKLRIIIPHMKIIVCQRYTGKHFINRYTSFSGFIPKLENTAPVTFRQQNGLLTSKYVSQHSFPSLIFSAPGHSYTA